MDKKQIKNIILIFFIMIFLNIQTIIAITPTDTFKVSPKPTVRIDDDSSPTPFEIDKIQKIKEMVASKVAELKLVEKKGMLGKVNEVSSNTQITITDLSGSTKIIDIDELTKFQSSSNKSFGISDLNKGDLISAVGLYNKDTQRLLARFITATAPFNIHFEGIVVSKDSGQYTLKVVDNLGNSKTVEIETTTKNRSYSKNSGLVKSGFSKIEKEQRVFVVGYYDLKDNNLIIADRIIHFIDIPPSEDMIKFKDLNISQSSISANTQ